jgi:hypothetical protein
MSRWSYPIYNARYPSGQEMFGSAEEAAAGFEILDMPNQKVADGIGKRLSRPILRTN